MHLRTTQRPRRPLLFGTDCTRREERDHMTTHCHTTIKALIASLASSAHASDLCHFSVRNFAFPLEKTVTPPKTLPWTDKFCQIVRKQNSMMPAHLLISPQGTTTKRVDPIKSARCQTPLTSGGSIDYRNLVFCQKPELTITNRCQLGRRVRSCEASPSCGCLPRKDLRQVFVVGTLVALQ
jgi:hypothetical protein